MAKDELRIQYSGLIIFGSQLVSVATGMAFILLLTRNMTTPEYGVWSNIFDLTGYFLLFAGFVPFWAMRFVARRNEGAAETAVLANLIVALALAAVYIPLVPLVTAGLHISGSYVPVYLLASAQMITVYVISALESCLRAEKPQVIGYGLLLEEACKLVLAAVLIVGLHQLFLGAMLSLILSALLQALYYVRLLSRRFGRGIRWDYVREWLKGSVAILYNSVGSQLAAFVFILLLVYGGQEARADYQAATTFAAVIGYSLSLAFALYPKLLAEESMREVTTSLRTVLMFAFPLAAIVISTSQSLLTVLNVSYRSASTVLILLVVDALIVLLSQFYTYVLYGVERLDKEARIPLRRLVRSRMFKVLSLPYVQAAVALPATFIVLSVFAIGHAVQAAVYVAIISIIAHAVTFGLTFLVMHRSVRIVVPWRSVAKYLAVSAVVGIILYVLPHSATLALTFAAVVGGAVLYAVLLLVADEDARTLVRLILKELGMSSDG
jgi:O-antigen/teichoic acid export membrane protein